MGILLNSESTTITTALTSGLTSIAGQATDSIAGVLPAALGVMGAMLVITVGIRAFKKITGK